jgi:hypothetical protein
MAILEDFAEQGLACSDGLPSRLSKEFCFTNRAF